MEPIRVLPVDDSVVMRRALTDMLGVAEDIEVQRAAASGEIALRMMREQLPDVVVLDVDMPGMGGLQTLAAIRREHPRLPVVMFSALTDAGSSTTVEALALGASDYLAKPAGLAGGAPPAEVAAELVRKVRALAGRSTAGLAAQPPAAAPAPAPRRRAPVSGGIDAVVLGCSTGGPNALTAVVPALPADLPVPVLVVQHMPPSFTGLLAQRLDQCGRLRAAEGRAGARVVGGSLWLAPGGQHMVVQRHEDGVVLALNEDPPENSCRPAVDVLFRSAVRCWGGRVLAVVLTGMGQDGLRGCEEIAAAGGQVVVQDQETSVVWGMPGAVASTGLAHAVLPIDAIGAEIVRRVAAGRSPGAARGAR